MSNIKLPIAELKPALVGLGKLITRHSTLPVLKCVKIERTKDGWITLTSTDLDSFATVRLEEPTQGPPIQVLVPYEDLTRITKKCQKDETIVLQKANGDKTLVQYPIGNQTGEEHVESLPVEEYPPIPKIKSDQVSVPGAVRSSIMEAFECASTDETRRILNGVYLDVSDRQCHQVVSTDGRCLYGANSFTLPLTSSLLIPYHKFIEWKEFNNDGEWQVRVNADPALVQISTRKWRFITRQIEGNYPNWRQVVPKEDQFNTTVVLSPAAIETITAVIPRIPCHDVVNNPIGIVVIDKKTVLLRGRGVNDQKWTDLDVPGVSIKGKPVMIFLNRDFLTKALCFGMGEIQIIDSLSPIRFSNGGGKQMIVMPVRGQEPTAAPQPPPASEKPAEEAHNASDAPTTERSTTMPRTTNRITGNGNTNGNGHHETTETKSTVEVAFEKIETIKGSYREAIRGLNDLTDTLKQVQREQKSTDKEVASVRTTLEKLQSVRI